jgi:hypothetical protein
VVWMCCAKYIEASVGHSELTVIAKSESITFVDHECASRSGPHLGASGSSCLGGGACLT